tara:strand:+ start:548 stop:1309 length:762 start_codon:yes stop_codon:yes gene_type:complete
MAYKYKLKEIEVGDIEFDNGTKSTVTNIDPETGAVSWDIDYIPNIDKLVEDSMKLASTAKGVYQKAKDDKKFLDIYEQAKQLRNVIRTHVRNNYPEDYKKAIREEEVDEVSMSGAAGAYLTPYAFRKKGSKSDDEAYKKLGYKVVKEKALPVVRKKLAKVPKAKKVASKYRMKMPSGLVSTLGYTVSEDATKSANIHKQGQHPGEDLGPGPKAGDEGVTDNAYTKQFKYKLVPKNKDGTYVQKGSGMVVKNLF